MRIFYTQNNNNNNNNATSLYHISGSMQQKYQKNDTDIKMTNLAQHILFLHDFLISDDFVLLDELSVLLTATPTRISSLQWRHNGCDGVSNHQPHDCLLNRLFKAQFKENIKALRHWPWCGNSPVTVEFPTRRPVTRKMYPFDDVIVVFHFRSCSVYDLQYPQLWRWNETGEMKY